MKTFETQSERETIEVGVLVGGYLIPGDTVACYGEIGSGKTRFIQGVCKALGVTQHVASPTFTIIKDYAAHTARVYHFDFYRLDSEKDLREIGFQEFLAGGDICLIEWAENVKRLLPPARYDVHLYFGDADRSRRIVIEHLVEVPA